MQDIIGCRIIVANRCDQYQFLDSLWLPQPSYDQFEPIGVNPGPRPFREATLIDRSESPSHGYRAVRLVVTEHAAPYEIQVRTRLQDRWAQLSERIDDRFPGTKYGQGPPVLQEMLRNLSKQTAEAERDYAEAKSLDENSGGEISRVIKAQEARVENTIDALIERYEQVEATLGAQQE